MMPHPKGAKVPSIDTAISNILSMCIAIKHFTANSEEMRADFLEESNKLRKMEVELWEKELVVKEKELNLTDERKQQKKNSVLLQCLQVCAVIKYNQVVKIVLTDESEAVFPKEVTQHNCRLEMQS